MIANHPTESSIEVALAGELVHLLASSALFWPAGATLFIADPHFGKAAAFRRFGIAAPDSTLEDLERLAILLRDTRATSLSVLGDFFHARSGLSDSMLTALRDWRRHRAELEIVLVRGNHDRSAGYPPADWRVRCETEPWQIGPFACCHVPCECDSG